MLRAITGLANNHKSCNKQLDAVWNRRFSGAAYGGKGSGKNDNRWVWKYKYVEPWP